MSFYYLSVDRLLFQNNRIIMCADEITKEISMFVPFFVISLNYIGYLTKLQALKTPKQPVLNLSAKIIVHFLNICAEGKHPDHWCVNTRKDTY